jgi:tyrosine-protein phosphatase SIW14
LVRSLFSPALAGFLIASLLACGGHRPPSPAGAATIDATAPIANFAHVREGLLRGGHPDHDGLEYLQRLGVKTILDLEIGDLIEATPAEIHEEEQTAKEMGFHFVRQPLSAFQPFVSDAEMNRVLRILGDADQAPVYVHCKHGQDRTGLVVGLERVFNEGWGPGKAYAEMRALGFHPAFFGLTNYFKWKTGYGERETARE